jgi:hypothetical protein
MRYGLALASIALTFAALANGEESAPTEGTPTVVNSPMAMTLSKLPAPEHSPGRVEAEVADAPPIMERPRRGMNKPAAMPPMMPPAAPVTLPKIPKEFQILLTNSIFSKNVLPGQIGANGLPLNGGGGPNGGPDGAPPGPSMALRGVVRKDGKYVADFEDPATHQIQCVQEGEMLGGGKVTQINQHGLSFAMLGKVTQVALGQNLRGEVVPPPPPPPPAPVPGKNGPPGGPNGGPPGPGGPPNGMPPGAVAVEGMPAPDGAVDEGQVRVNKKSR